MITRFTPYEIQECLFDKKRTFDFLCAINETVKPGDTVVDAGSGSGILGLFAAKAGAKRVYCIESNRRFIEIIKENARLNGFSRIVQVIHGDATSVRLPSRVDVVICELLSTGLFYEPEVQVINSLRRFLKKDGRIIPMACRSWIQLINAQRSVYGLYFDYDSRYELLRNDKSISNRVVFDSPNFYVDEPLEINKKVTVTAEESGIVNAVRISSKARLSDNIHAGQSRFLFNPLVIFLRKNIDARKGRKYEVQIRYKRSEDTLGTDIRIRAL